MAAPVETGLVFGDLERYEVDERRRYELIDGGLYVTAKGVRRHQAVIVRISHLLFEYAEAAGGEVYAEPGVYYDQRNFVIPDVVLVSAETLARLGPTHVDAPPDLLVEVSSPSTRHHDVVRKRALYEREGVAEYWFVDLDADRIEVYRLTDGRYPRPIIAERGDSISPPHLSGLTVAVDDAVGPIPD